MYQGGAFVRKGEFQVEGVCSKRVKIMSNWDSLWSLHYELTIWFNQSFVLFSECCVCRLRKRLNMHEDDFCDILWVWLLYKQNIVLHHYHLPKSDARQWIEGSCYKLKDWKHINRAMVRFMWFEFAWEHIESGFACLFDVFLCLQTYSSIFGLLWG